MEKIFFLIITMSECSKARVSPAYLIDVEADGQKGAGGAVLPETDPHIGLLTLQAHQKQHMWVRPVGGEVTAAACRLAWDPGPLGGVDLPLSLWRRQQRDPRGFY